MLFCADRGNCCGVRPTSAASCARSTSCCAFRPAESCSIWAIDDVGLHAVLHGLQTCAPRVRQRCLFVVCRGDHLAHKIAWRLCRAEIFAYKPTICVITPWRAASYSSACARLCPQRGVVGGAVLPHKLKSHDRPAECRFAPCLGRGYRRINLPFAKYPLKVFDVCIDIGVKEFLPGPGGFDLPAG